MALTAQGRDTFPLTGGWVQRISRRLGTPVGMKRALRIVRLMKEQGVIEEAGSYQKRRFGYLTGFRVKLYRSRLRHKTSSVGRRRRQVPWWQHPLFGFGTSSYPLGLPEHCRKWKPPPEQ